jgi:hypothetical protein
MERLFTDDTYIALLTGGTKFDLVFSPQDSPYKATQYETWTNCTILNCERTASEDKASRTTVTLRQITLAKVKLEIANKANTENAETQSKVYAFLPAPQELQNNAV